jgi:hypothetical protein
MIGSGSYPDRRRDAVDLVPGADAHQDEERDEGQDGDQPVATLFERQPGGSGGGGG